MIRSVSKKDEKPLHRGYECIFDPLDKSAVERQIYKCADAADFIVSTCDTIRMNGSSEIR